MKMLIIITVILFGTKSFAKERKTEHVLKMIEILTESSRPEFNAYAHSIVKWSNKYQIDAKIVVAVIMTESSFISKSKSKTGDLGLGQVNPQVWSAEFLRIYKYRLDTKKLLTDYDYNIQKTVQILALMKNNKDLYWVGKYHSKTPSLKKAYSGRVFTKFDKIAEGRRIASNP